MFSSILLHSSLLLLAKASHQPVSAIAPVADLSNGKYQGYTNATSGLTYFLGICYAAAPYVLLLYIIYSFWLTWKGRLLTYIYRVGHLRFRVPNAPPSFSGTHDATKYGVACIQQPSLVLSFPGIPPISITGPKLANQSKDC